MAVVFILFLISVSIANSLGKVMYLQLEKDGMPNSKLVIFDEKTASCEITTNPLKIMYQIHSKDNLLMKVTKSDEMEKVLEKCSNNQYSVHYFTFPGTLWCGPGDIASSYEDLGTERETDKCCRDHDHCDNIAVGEMKHNLTNNSPFTRLHCDCDETFQNCLRIAKSDTAKAVGEFYFNLVQSQCYKLEHPIMSCAIMPKFGNCDEYKVDDSKPKIWQFFQPKLYMN